MYKDLRVGLITFAKQVVFFYLYDASLVCLVFKTDIINLIHKRECVTNRPLDEPTVL